MFRESCFLFYGEGMSPINATLKYKYNHVVCSITCSKISSDILDNRRCMSFQLKSGRLYFEFNSEFSLRSFCAQIFAVCLVWFLEETFEYFLIMN